MKMQYEYMEEFSNTGYAVLMKPALDAALRSGGEKDSTQGDKGTAKNKEEQTRVYLSTSSGLPKADKLYSDRDTDGSMTTDDGQTPSKASVQNGHEPTREAQGVAPKTRAGGGSVPPR